MDIKTVESKVDALKFLNKLWEKSQSSGGISEEEKAQFLNAQLTLIEDILRQIIPTYTELLDKDNPTDEEVWTLKVIEEMLVEILFSLTHSLHFQVYISMANMENLPQDLFKKALDIYAFIMELTGFPTEHNGKIEEQIQKSLKNIKDGKVKDVDSLFRELKI